MLIQLTCRAMEEHPFSPHFPHRIRNTGYGSHIIAKVRHMRVKRNHFYVGIV